MTNTEKESKQAKQALDEAKKRRAEKDLNYNKMPAEKKGRGGKGVTIIKGFQGNEEKLNELGKDIKKSLGIGGSMKKKEIILQGRIQEKVIHMLNQKGYKAKKVGG